MNIAFPHTFFPGLRLDNGVNNIGDLKVADRTGLYHFLKNLQIRHRGILLHNITYKSSKFYYIENSNIFSNCCFSVGRMTADPTLSRLTANAT